VITKRARFLVLRGGAIGDFILTLPALAALRRQWERAYVELVGYPHIAGLGLAGGLADKVVSLDKADMARLFVPNARLTTAQREYFRGFDLILSYLYDPDETVRANLYAAGAELVVYGSPLVKEGHAADQLFKPLNELAIYESYPRPRLALNAPLQEWGRSWLLQQGLSNALAIHPGSGSRGKQWPLNRFIEVADRVRASEPAEPFFVLGEAEREMSEVLSGWPRPYSIARGLSLTEVAALLSACGGYLGNDSGITHLAAALGLPTVALFGPSAVERWAPRGEHVKVLPAPAGDLTQLSADRVFRELPSTVS